MFAFLPVAAISFVSLELALDSLDRLTSPGIERALATADSLVAMSLTDIEDRCVNLIRTVAPGSPVADYGQRGFDFAIIARGADTAMAVFDEATDSLLNQQYKSLAGFLGSKDTVGRSGFGDEMLIFGVIKTDDMAVMAGYVLSSGYNSLFSRFGANMQRFEQLKLLKTSGKKFMRAIWALANIGYLMAIVLVTRITARGLTRPLSRMAELVERVGPGNWEVSLQYGRRDEIGLLVSGFNRMSERLSETTRRMIEAEKTAAWEQTARVIAHGIKNILAPVKLAVARLSKRVDVDDPDMRSALTTIQVELGLLERTARDFSTYGRPVESKVTNVDLNAVVKQAVRIGQADCSGTEFVLSLGEGLPEIAGDENMLREAVVNLIKNACEAAGDSGSVTIATSAVADCAALSVSDTGGGIDPGILENLFEPYVTTKQGGTGLGLAIVNKIVISSGGNITFDTGPEGTTFTLTFSAECEDDAD